ncbi:MAG: hypothetical protein K6F52_07450 [Clostridia bacterium]|nr:hypothetical protein [Clostridia bacterium]
MKTEASKFKRIIAAATAVTVAAVCVFIPLSDCAYAASKNAGKKGYGIEQAGRQGEALTVTDRLVAHGGGAIEGFETSNSAEAVVSAINNGFTAIELDMGISSDGKVVMVHDWETGAENYYGRTFSTIPTAAEFSRLSVYGRFKTLTLDKLIEIIDEAVAAGHTDLKFITDTKNNNRLVLNAIASQYPDYKKYFIPQIYDYSEYDAVKALGFDDVYLTLYMMNTVDYSYLHNFVKQKDIKAVIVSTTYAVRGIPERLAADGIKVYCHPVSSFEEYNALRAKGVYGVYTSFLTPEEAEGEFKNYYLEQTAHDGRKIKLTDVNLGDFTAEYVRSIVLHGAVSGDMLHYEIDGVTMIDGVPEAASPGIHKLTIDISRPVGLLYANDGTIINRGDPASPVYTLTYYIWKNADGTFRLADRAYAHRLENLKQPPDFREVVLAEKQDASSDTKNTSGVRKSPGETVLSEKLKSILSQSFIAASGSYYYYNNTECGTFRVGEELLYVQSYGTGTELPVADTARALGASGVYMDPARYIYLDMPDARYYTQINGYYVYCTPKSRKMNNPVELYRNKAMAPSELFSVITERNSIDDGETFILLPKGISVSADERETIFEAAKKLYNS